MPELFDSANPPILDDQQYSILIFVYIIMICGLLLNLFFLFILLFHWKKVFKSSNLLLNLNLSLADSVFYLQGLIFRYPLLIHRSFYPKVTNSTIVGTIIYTLGSYALMSVVLMAVERYTIIIRGKRTTTRRIAIFTIGCMSFALFSSCLPIILTDAPYLYSESGLYFTIHIGFPTPAGYFLTAYVLLAQVVCLNLIFLCYAKIIQKVKSALFKPAHSPSTSSFTSSRASRPFLPHSPSKKDNNQHTTSISNVNQSVSVGPTSSTTPSLMTSKTPPSTPKQPKDLELQIVRKAIAISFIHLIFWTPYMTYCLLMLIGVKNLKLLDFFVVIGIEANSSVNATFSLLMDPKIQKFMMETWIYFRGLRKNNKNSHSIS